MDLGGLLLKNFPLTCVEGLVIEHNIKTEAYWAEFAITDQDIEELSVQFLEVERPLSLYEMARQLVVHRCRHVESQVRKLLTQGTVYRPNGTFAVGEKVVFPQLGFALGTVIDLREGNNPEFGEFKVITVRFDDGLEETRQFAAELKTPHKLAFPDGTPPERMFTISPDEVAERYGEMVAAQLDERLRADPNFVSFRGEWLPADMMAEVHIGHLNIAEALLDMEGQPLSTVKLLTEVELPEEIPQPIKEFSLNYAMAHDGRFDDVGSAEHVLWGLRQWMPTKVLSPPARLLYEPIDYDRTVLDVTHLELEREIDDETSELIAPPSAADAATATLLLNYPHWREGTLPITDRLRFFFPVGMPGQHTMITFVDRAGGKQFPGWVVHAHRFVYGLEEWYRENKILPGAFVVLERDQDPYRVVIDVIPRRMQREWVRVAIVTEDGELGFQMQKRPVACEYDELCIMDEGNRQEIDRLWQREQERDRPLAEIVESLFLELAKLNPNGMVHAKTLYNAVNILRRCPPGRVFATLFDLPQFAHTGDGYWVFRQI